jgi:hypothetical protein
MREQLMSLKREKECNRDTTGGNIGSTGVWLYYKILLLKGTF